MCENMFAINNQSKALVIVLLKVEYWEKNLIAYSICFLGFGTFVEMLKAHWGRIKASNKLVRHFSKEGSPMAVYNCAGKSPYLEDRY
jgi:hypothetical protein